MARNAQERGPWRRARDRALYSRRIQRADERWALATRVVAGLLRHPELVLAALGRREPVERDGRVLNRSVQALLELAGRFDVAVAGPRAGAVDRPGGDAGPAQCAAARLAMPVRTDVHVWGRVVSGSRGSTARPGEALPPVRRRGSASAATAAWSRQSSTSTAAAG